MCDFIKIYYNMDMKTNGNYSLILFFLHCFVNQTMAFFSVIMLTPSYPPSLYCSLTAQTAVTHLATAERLSGKFSPLRAKVGIRVRATVSDAEGAAASLQPGCITHINLLCCVVSYHNRHCWYTGTISIV